MGLISEKDSLSCDVSPFLSSAVAKHLSRVLSDFNPVPISSEVVDMWRQSFGEGAVDFAKAVVFESTNESLPG